MARIFKAGEEGQRNVGRERRDAFEVVQQQAVGFEQGSCSVDYAIAKGVAGATELLDDAIGEVCEVFSAREDGGFDALREVLVTGRGA